MKKYLFMLTFVMIILLCGCSNAASHKITNYAEEISKNADDALSDNDIETLISWSFQFNEGTNDYSIFFGLLNKNEEYISADVDINIRIVNENDEEVYNKTKAVSKNDFNHYTNQSTGEHYLANVKIPASEITSGTSMIGKVFLTVYNNIVLFDEVNCEAYNLPIKDIQVTFDSLPLNLKVIGFDGTTKSIIQINDVSYEFEKDFQSQLKITIFSEKIYGISDFGNDMISYKLYDKEGYIVDTGNVYLSPLDEGDKFKNDSIVIYNIMPGESYTLKLVECD